MQFECSRCHHRTTVKDGDTHRCAHCKAEAGLETIGGSQPAPVKAFAVVIAAAFIATVVGLGFMGAALS